MTIAALRSSGLAGTALAADPAAWRWVRYSEVRRRALPPAAPAASPRAPRPRPTRPTRCYRHRRAAAEVEAQEAELAPAADKLKGMGKKQR